MNLEPEGAVGRLNPLPSPQLMNTTTTGTERLYTPLGGADTLQHITMLNSQNEVFSAGKFQNRILFSDRSSQKSFTTS